jgi:hypothetical protein
MPIHFIDNYPKSNLESVIKKSDGRPLYGEIWVYQELQRFNERNLLPDEVWYVKHNYNLSRHPSANKVEGQVDFLILSRFGLLIIEVKGGGIEVDENDTYFSFDRKQKEDRYVSQNPFTQAKEYVHSIKGLLDSSPFIYRAVIFPHESGFELKGPQLTGYRHLFLSKRELDACDTAFGRNDVLFDFLLHLPKESRRVLIQELNPAIDRHKVEQRIWKQYPELTKQEIIRLKCELFPTQTTYGFDPEKIRNEIILEENYEIFNGLRKNRKVLVQGGPGTGKTILATKFLADMIIKQQRGVYYCANKLLRAKMEYWAFEELKLDKNLIQFRVFHKDTLPLDTEQALDFIIIDEAQEFFDKGLFETFEQMEWKNHQPRWLLLYDPEQAIIQDFKDIDWYADYFIEADFVHYLFDTMWRCCQEKTIGEIGLYVKDRNFKKCEDTTKHLTHLVMTIPEKLEILAGVIESSKSDIFKNIILVDSNIFDEFRTFASDYFPKHLEELTDANINVRKQVLRYTTPIKYRGLEAENIFVVTTGFDDRSRIQNYIAVTRAIYHINFVIWK